jgi:hypothetical protein
MRPDQTARNAVQQEVPGAVEDLLGDVVDAGVG